MSVHDGTLGRAVLTDASGDRILATGGDVQRAIEIMEECRLSHVEWADWQDEAGEGWAQAVDGDSVGDPEHHRSWVSKYDHVLAVLRGESS